jgi:predicted transcriptional regulator
MTERQDVLSLAAQIVSAHVKKNAVAPDALPGLIREVFSTLTGLGKETIEPAKATPAVPIRQSIKPDRIICLEDGKSFSMLKRHLMTDHKLTPEQYRERWGLPRDYPMVAPNYADKRSTLAKQIGLGRRGGAGSRPQVEDVFEEEPEEDVSPVEFAAPAKAAPQKRVLTRPGNGRRKKKA